MNQKELRVEIHKAAHYGDVEGVRRCLEAGASANDYQGLAPLHRAAEQGCTAVIDYLMGAGAEVDLLDANGDTPVVRAALGRRKHVVEQLLARGAVPNSALLSIASAAGWVDIAQRCLAAGLNVNQGDKYGAACLHWACAAGNPEMIRLLIREGAQVSLRAKDGSSPIHFACGLRLYPPGTHKFQIPQRGEDPVGTITLLLESGADPNARGADGTTPLLLAANSARSGIPPSLWTSVQALDKIPPSLWADIQAEQKSHRRTSAARLCRRLLRAGADPSRQDQAGTSPLHVAVRCKDYKLAKLLLELGTDANVRDKKGRTPLWVALENQVGPQIVDLLIRSGADINAADAEGIAPVHLAARSRKHGLLTKLLQLGANPTVRSDRGYTVLMGAAAQGDLRLVSKLLDMGMDVNAQTDPEGSCSISETPLLGAVEQGRIATVRLLLKRGASVHVPERGEKPLHVAVRKGFHAITKLLLAAGADVNSVDDGGFTVTEALLGCGQDVKTREHVLALLLSRKPDLSHRNPKCGSVSALELAIVQRWGRKTINTLLAQGALPEGLTGHLLLSLAVQARDPDVVKLLLEMGASASARDEDGKTALHHAMAKDTPKEIILALLAAGAELDAQDNQGQTPLHWAASADNSEAARLLLERGANQGARARDGRTPKAMAWGEAKSLLQ